MLNSQSFEHIYHTHKNRIYYYLHRLQIPPSLHDEFYAEGMYVMWQAYESYNPTKGALSTYLNYQIRFRLIDLIRKKDREQDLVQSYIKEEALLLHNGNRDRNRNQLLIENEHFPIQDHSLWLSIKSQLTLRQWKWVYYFIVCDMTLKEIASLEDVTLEAVKSWAKGARRKLRQNKTLKQDLIQFITI